MTKTSSTGRSRRIDLGKLKGNDGDQNYAIPAGTDLEKFKAVSVFCERFNANFEKPAPLERVDFRIPISSTRRRLTCRH